MDMRKFMITMLMLMLNFFTTSQITAKPDFHSADVNNTDVPTINITKLDINDTALNLTWEIRNNSRQDAWILAGLGKSGTTISAFVAEDGQTLLMRRRLDQYWKGNTPFPTLNGRYVRLYAGHVLTESVSLAIPIWPVHDQVLIGSTYIKEPIQLTRLAIEIGYYTGDFPSTIISALEQDEKNPRKIPAIDPYYTRSITEWFGGLRGFVKLNEILSWPDDEVLIPYTSQAFSGEQFLRTTVDNLHIPCEKERGGGKKLDFVFSPYARVEIHYQPSSMLEYFYPYLGQQSLLSPSEREYLYSMKTIVFENPDNIKIIANELNKGNRAAGIVVQKNVVCLACFRNDELLMSLPIYNDNSIVTEGRYRFEYPYGVQSFRELTPHLKQIDLRVNCASNLKHLWNRFCLYDKVVKSGLFRRRRTSYPSPNNWCTSILDAYRIKEKDNEYLLKPYKCPSAGYGECHYAMNPNCKLESSPYMVLLFETKAGWNQYGGPELFTFDNHDPRGGCVLLNDGTVKFIRTTEELQQLRWK